MSRQLNIELRSDSIYFSRNIETSRNVVNVKGSSTSNDWVNGGNFWYGNVQNFQKKKILRVLRESLCIQKFFEEC